MQSLQDVLQETKRHHARHLFSTSSEEDQQQQRCRTMLKRVQKVLLFLSSTQLDYDQTMLALELLRTVLSGQFCPYSHAVFGYGDREVAGRSLAALVYLSCNGSFLQKASEVLLSSVISLATFLAQYDSDDYFLKLIHDLVLFLKDSIFSTSMTFQAFPSTLGKQSSFQGGLTLDISTDEKKTNVRIGICYLLRAFCQIPVVRASKSIGLCLELLNRALNETSTPKIEQELIAWIRLLPSFISFPNGFLQCCYILFDHSES